jgi:hypothetical protein
LGNPALLLNRLRDSVCSIASRVAKFSAANGWFPHRDEPPERRKSLRA